MLTFINKHPHSVLRTKGFVKNTFGGSQTQWRIFIFLNQLSWVHCDSLLQRTVTKLMWLRILMRGNEEFWVNLSLPPFVKILCSQLSESEIENFDGIQPTVSF